jgi:hypothetical protein
MRKTALNALVALVIAGSTGQTSAATDNHVRATSCDDRSNYRRKPFYRAPQTRSYSNIDLTIEQLQKEQDNHGRVDGPSALLLMVGNSSTTAAPARLAPPLVSTARTMRTDFRGKVSSTHYRSQPNGDFMRQTALTILSALLIAGSATQIATASEHHGLKMSRALQGVGEQFRNADDSIARRAAGWCSQEPGNPYNEQTDYEGWSAWRQLGSWDSRNDC